MNAGADDFRRHFELLSDPALLATNRADLVAIAKDCFDFEVSRRGLNALPDEESFGPVKEPDAEKNGMVVVAAYTSFEEASLARGLLQSAGIECFVGNEHVGLGNFEMRLSVAEEFADAALDVLESEITDEDLAAQAEAAGNAGEPDPAEHEHTEPYQSE